MDLAAALNPGASSGLRSILIHNDSRAFPVQPSTRSIRSEMAAGIVFGWVPNHGVSASIGSKEVIARCRRASAVIAAVNRAVARPLPEVGPPGEPRLQLPAASERGNESPAVACPQGDSDKINSARTDMFQQAMQAGDAVGVNFRRPAAQAMRPNFGFHAKNNRAAETRPPRAAGRRPVAGNDPGRVAVSNRPRARPFSSISLRSADRISSAYHFPNFLSE